MPWWCGHDASAWIANDADRQRGLADTLIAFERADGPAALVDGDRFTGEWALVTHQMVALGLAQLCLAHPEWTRELAPVVTDAAAKSFRVEMRGFGTRAWRGEDAMASLDSDHGHAYLAYAALALGMARLVDPAFPPAARRAARRADRRVRTSFARIADRADRDVSRRGVSDRRRGGRGGDRGPRSRHPHDARRGAAAVGRRVCAPCRSIPRAASSSSEWTRRPARRTMRRARRGPGLAAYFAGFADRDVARELAGAACCVTCRRGSASAACASTATATPATAMSIAGPSPRDLGVGHRIRARLGAAARR